MIKVHLTANLQKYYPVNQFEVEAKTVMDLLQKMDQVQKLFSTYILDDDKSVRKHVNIFINGELLPKKETTRALKDGSTIHIMQALSGG